MHLSIYAIFTLGTNVIIYRNFNIVIEGRQGKVKKLGTRMSKSLMPQHCLSGNNIIDRRVESKR